MSNQENTIPKGGLKTRKFVIKGKEEGESDYDVIIKEPGMPELKHAMSLLTKSDVAGAGESLFATCGIPEKCPDAVKNSPIMLMSLYIEIANEFLELYGVEVKKN